ncbi:helix-turn-helix domain-containing protein [Salarchaeum sp. JOR-1]|uniref:helix-turn-helix domain-containing protein n=1 Tax=Salarchaeum sp. JOR-1 TaxID=2599399 RepID=UPI0011984405|nr:helix-turn-helix domain-containing protein [Salarchaeum sp. JOR-1]QDX41217.1 helix-turn-helix domain-containing protein [Salarchaeum sp. JOR-1]
MSLIAEFRLTGPGLVLRHARNAVPEVDVNVQHEVGIDPQRPILFFWATPDGDADASALDDFHDAVAADGSVRDATVLDDLGDRRLYRVQIHEHHDTVLYPAYVELGAALVGLYSAASGWKVEMRFPHRDALTDFRAACERNGVSFSLHRLYQGVNENEPKGLTDAQREALRVAMALGYFGVPREAALADVADELDVSTQAASERVRRAVKALVESAV